MLLSALGVGLGLAVAGSIALNASYLLQHAGTRDAPAIDARHPLRTLRVLVGSRWWLAGLVAGLAGWALHVGALAHAPLSLVQAFAAGGLALTVPAAARFLGERLTRRDRLTVAAMVTALAALGIGAVGTAPAAVPAAPMAAFLGGCAVAAGMPVILGRGHPSARALGAVGGVLYGAADAATKAVAIAAHGGLGAALLGPWGAAVVPLASMGAFLCFQRGLQIGPAVPVIALATAGTNATAILCGLFVFGDPLGTTLPIAIVHATALGVAALTGLMLAAAQARIAPEAPHVVPQQSPGAAPRHPVPGGKVTSAATQDAGVRPATRRWMSVATIAVAKRNT